MRNSKTTNRSVDIKTLKALASPARLLVLQYLKNPAKHFSPQVDGGFDIEGVCADYFRQKLGIAAATASRHLTILSEAKLIIATRKKGWTFYRRDEGAIAQFVQQLKVNL